MPFVSGLAVALSLAVNISTAGAVSPQPLPQAQTVEQYVEAYFADEPIMVDIAQCESHFRQFDTNGSVYRGVQNNQDVGVMQINEHYHLDTAKKLGIDLYTTQGNVAYARYLYEKEGTAPWDSSKPCWDKSDDYKVLALAKK